MESTKSESPEFLKKPQGPTLYLDSESRRLITSPEDPNKQPKMRRLHDPLLTVVLLLLLLTAGAVCSSTQYIHLRNVSPSIHPPTQEEVRQFQELLNTVDPASLHKVLHEHLKDKYQHGVYSEDKTAIQIVHKQNSEVAHGLIELAKRQGGASSNSNSTSTPTPSSASVSHGATPTLPSSTAEVSPTVTSTREPPTTSAIPALPSTTNSISASQAPTDSSTPKTEAAPTSKPQVSSKGSTPTPEPKPSSITRQVVYKTTLADGVQTIVTATTVVPAPVQGGDGSGSKTNTASASLQTNAAAKSGQVAKVATLLGAVAIVAVVVW